MLQDAQNTGAAKDVLAVGDDRVDHRIDANGTLLLTLDDKLESLLQKNAVFGSELNHALFLEKFQQISNALFA